ncbi:MAG: hypothetical protein Kapaf2KO_12570 [Candidatus Kapaibacteriales bacterium]
MKFLLALATIALIITSCGLDEETMKEIEEIAKNEIEKAEQQNAEAEQESPDTEVNISVEGYKELNFDKVYSYQANIADREIFIHMVHSASQEEEYKATTIKLAATEPGDYDLNYEMSTDIFVEIGDKNFRTGKDAGTITINSLSDGYIEVSFSDVTLPRTNNQGDETITLPSGTLKLPLNDMRRK